MFASGICSLSNWNDDPADKCGLKSINIQHGCFSLIFMLFRQIRNADSNECISIDVTKMINQVFTDNNFRFIFRKPPHRK